MTTNSTLDFPLSLLTKCRKYSVDIPSTIKGNMLALDKITDDQTLSSSKKPTQFKKLLFGLNFFHSIVATRWKYGPMGLSCRYSFNNVDHGLMMEAIRQYLNPTDDKDDEVPYKALQYLASEVYYGGHVLDRRDSRCISRIISDFISPSIMDDKYAFTPQEVYHYPSNSNTVGLGSYLAKLPNIDAPDVVGLHDSNRAAWNTSQTQVVTRFNTTEHCAGVTEELADSQSSDN